MKINVGHILEHTVRTERIGISELSRKLKVSRRTIYNWFSQEDLNPNIILRVGEVIGYDFMDELPESFIRNHRPPQKTTKKNLLNGMPTDNNSVYFWMNKYVALLEKYNEMLSVVSDGPSSDIHNSEMEK